MSIVAVVVACALATQITSCAFVGNGQAWYKSAKAASESNDAVDRAVEMSKKVFLEDRKAQTVRVKAQKTPGRAVFSEAEAGGGKDRASISTAQVEQELLSGVEGRDRFAFEFEINRAGRWTYVETEERPAYVEVRSQPAVELHPRNLEATPEQVSKLKASWAANADKMESNPAATEAELAELQAVLPFEIPGLLKELLQLTNGARYKGDEYEEPKFAGGWPLLSTREIIKTYQNWLEVDQYRVSYDVSRPGALAPFLVHPGWIPIADEMSGNYFAMDFAPGPNGTPGQIIEYGNDGWEGAFLRADSLNDFIEGQWIREDREPVHADSASKLTKDADSLDIRDSDKLARLPKGPSVRWLGIQGAGTKSLEGIQDMPIQVLELEQTSKLSLKPLAGHPVLRRIEWDSPGELEDLDVLSELPQLRELALKSLPNDAVLQAVIANPKFHRFDVQKDITLSDIVKLQEAVTGEDVPATIKEGQEG